MTIILQLLFLKVVCCEAKHLKYQTSNFHNFGQIQIRRESWYSCRGHNVFLVEGWVACPQICLSMLCYGNLQFVYDTLNLK